MIACAHKTQTRTCWTSQTPAASYLLQPQTYHLHQCFKHKRPAGFRHKTALQMSHSRSFRLLALQGTNPTSTSTAPATLLKQTAAMFGASAVVGTLCDGQHSSHDVLHYAAPVLLQTPIGYSLETCWWVPLLFGCAGVVLGLSHPLLDDWRRRSSIEVREPVYGYEPTWPWVLLGIALFVMQYSASGQVSASLDGQSLLGTVPQADAVLAIGALATWAVLDGTPQGLFMAALTAAIGPAVEIYLISLGLYHYSHPDIAGIPTWIPWLYFAGAPAVGNLGRRVRAELTTAAE